MRVTILQTDIEWGSPHDNILRATALMDANPGSDLYVLPEMWSTGFAVSPEGIAEDEATSVSLRWMRSEAKARRCAICGSIAIRTSDGTTPSNETLTSNDTTNPNDILASDGISQPVADSRTVAPTYRNRLYFIDGRNGRETHYDKYHLFTYGGEHRQYQAGDGRVIVTFEGFRILLTTCYDLRFPVWSRYADALQYDAIVCVANWPASRQNAFQILTRARALENMAFMIAVNRTGRDPVCEYRGGSAIISPIGRTLARCCYAAESAATADISIDEVLRRRQKFPVLDDRDEFSLKCEGQREYDKKEFSIY